MVQTAASPDVLYPDADGQPMADNTKQYRWIVRLMTNLKCSCQRFYSDFKVGKLNEGMSHFS